MLAGKNKHNLVYLLPEIYKEEEKIKDMVCQTKHFKVPELTLTFLNYIHFVNFQLMWL